jgi:cysteine desulfuration protein SufE
MQSTSAKIPDSLDRIVKRLQRLSDPKQRYEQLILYGQKLPNFPDSGKVPENKVQGCVSQVYVTVSLDDQAKVQFSGDSDALISKGFLGLLIAGMNGMTLEEVQAISPDFITETGLTVSLTPSRANGFYNVFRTMKEKVASL